MSAIQFQPRYSVEDYLQWEGDWELWDGIPVAMAPSHGFGHGRAAFALAHTLQTQFDKVDSCGQCAIVLEIDWKVNTHTVVRPDLSVVCGPPPEHHILTAPALIAEFLSPATRHKDLTVKKALYAEEGVRFYVIGDPDTEELFVFYLTKEGLYEESAGTDLTLHEGCVVSINAAQVFS